jgi:hypothetical protein
VHDAGRVHRLQRGGQLQTDCSDDGRWQPGPVPQQRSEAYVGW